MAEEPKHTPSHHSSSYWKRHPERRLQPSANFCVELVQRMDGFRTGMSLYDVPHRWIAPTREAAYWLWEILFDWPFVAWVLAAICIPVAVLLTQEHMYLSARILWSLAALLALGKLCHVIARSEASSDTRKAKYFVAIVAIGVVYGAGFWVMYQMDKTYLASLPRADVHVDEVVIEILTSEQIGMMSGVVGSKMPVAVKATISGHNQSPTTPTLAFPMVNASISARPFITDPDEEEDLFTHGGWANETFVGWPNVLNPGQPFSFPKHDYLTTLDVRGVKNTGDVFFDNWNALVRGDIVIYVVTKTNVRDKRGKVPEVRTCNVFAFIDKFKRRNCAGQFDIGRYQP